MTYQGYKNYETWAVSLWINNDENIQSQWQERAQELVDEYGKEDAVHELAVDIAADADENCPELEGFYSGLLNSALEEVYWAEIAKEFVDECEESQVKDDSE
jgi:hypothetical protein